MGRVPQGIARELLHDHQLIVDNVHAVLPNGLHVDAFLDKAALVADHQVLMQIADLLREMFPTSTIRAVVSSERDAGALGASFAARLGRHDHADVTSVQATEQPDGSFRLPGSYPRGVPTLIVDDVVTTGNTISELIRTVQNAGGTIVGATTIWNRAGVTEDILGIPFRPLINIPHELWKPESCPMCRDGIPIANDLRIAHTDA